MPRITPFPWFDHRADRAMAFYPSVFEDSRAGQVAR